MGKQSLDRQLAPNEAKAVINRLRISTQKLNLVAGLIRGMDVSNALTQLSFSSKRIANDVKKGLQSAIANAENNHNLNVDSLYVKEAYVGKNIVMKRMHTRGRGKSARVFKPFANLTLILKEKERAVIMSAAIDILNKAMQKWEYPLRADMAATLGSPSREVRGDEYEARLLSYFLARHAKPDWIEDIGNAVNEINKSDKQVDKQNSAFIFWKDGLERHIRDEMTNLRSLADIAGMNGLLVDAQGKVDPRKSTAKLVVGA